ncbi:hypothetical protein UG46_10100 [Pseudomonas fluorescens]|nr:hypothetical protein UG46_10100 [Pseudomonas fluorescens]
MQQLPGDWEQKEITQIGAVVGGGTPSREVPSFWHGAIPWVTPGEVSGEEAKLLHDTNDHISALGLAGSGANLLPAGSLLVTTRATLGARVINAVPMATNQGFKSIVFKKPEEASYYFHLFEKLKPELVRRASGTTFLEISGAEFGSIKVPSPSSDEKLKIAQLLDTLDTAIHQTEAIVGKLKEVKQGLVHDLLTRGVDANGELRPSYEEAAELYQESPLGWVPKEWDIGLLGNALIGIDAGWSPSCPEEPPSAGEWGVLKVSAVSGGVFQPAESKRLPHGLRPDPSIEVHSGNVILARANGVADLVATTVYVDSTPKGLMLSDKTLRLNPYPSKLSSRFLAALMHHPATRRQIGGMLNGSSGQKNISQSQIKALIVAIPSVNEQKTSEMLICDTEQRIRTEQMQLRKLKATREGLMDDLLTGHVRVTPLLAQ